MKVRAVAIVAVPGVLLMLALLMAGGSAVMTAAETRTVLQQIINEAADTPTELQPLIDDVARRYGVDPDWLAAAIRTNPGWLYIPVTTRRQMLREAREANEDARQNPCHPEYTDSEPDPPPDCQDYEPPADWPTDRATLTAQWRAGVTAWLSQYLADVYGVANPAQIPQPADLGRRLYETWPAAQAQRAYESWQVLRAYRTATSSDRERQQYRALTDYEDYRWRLEVLDWEYQPPVDGGRFSRDWHMERPQNEGRAPTRHQGTDVFSPIGTPVLAVTQGRIIRQGWDYLGGWTLTLEEPDTGLRFYYAHLSSYATGIGQGQTVERGAVVGYVGTSGEGPEGTSNRITEPHLHFGIYAKDGSGQDLVLNPYPYLQIWSGLDDLDEIFVMPAEPPQGWTPVAGFAWPVEEPWPLTSPFGTRVSPIDGQVRLHAGIDIGVPTGTTVRASRDGTVITAERHPVYGLVVVIEHGDYRTLYAHNSALTVREGDHVQQGHAIAVSGSTGWSTGPHLHFEVYWQGTPVDPLQILAPR